MSLQVRLAWRWRIKPVFLSARTDARGYLARLRGGIPLTGRNTMKSRHRHLTFGSHEKSFTHARHKT